MSEPVRYHQQYAVKIEVREDIMTVLGDEKIYAERNPQGEDPEDQVYVKVENNSSDEDEDEYEDDDESGIDIPPVKLPRGQLLSAAQAVRPRSLFEKQRAARDAFIRDIVRRFKPRKIIWGKYKYLAQVFDYAGDVYYADPRLKVQFMVGNSSSSSSSSSISSYDEIDELEGLTDSDSSVDSPCIAKRMKFSSSSSSEESDSSISTSSGCSSGTE